LGHGHVRQCGSLRQYGCIRYQYRWDPLLQRKHGQQCTRHERRAGREPQQHAAGYLYLATRLQHEHLADVEYDARAGL
jgi:hypothetical protein